MNKIDKNLERGTPREAVKQDTIPSFRQLKNTQERNGCECQSTRIKAEYLNDKTLVHLGSINSEKEHKTTVSTSKAVTHSKLKPLDKQYNVVSKHLRVKAKNGTLGRRTAKPTDKAVQTSSRGNENFEAARCSKSRIRKNVIKTKRTGYRPAKAYSSIEYKLSLIHI